jgi:lipopolysaccharide/colanic/teichoic acid biosynthesis glycosyltransferase
MKKSKRLFDLFFTLLGLPFLLPLFFIIGLLIKLEDGGPIFFIQKRIGYKGKPFLMWKFRTMIVDAEKKGTLITIGKDPRITRVGYCLRKFKLDELPQLFNVLKGEMSLVGPRPEVEKYVMLYTPEQRQVLNLIPGMTDPASIKYVNENEILAQAEDPERVYIEKVMPEKIKLNLEYAKTASCWRDFLVVIKTVLRILS